MSEPSQFQALDRTQPGLALKPDKAGTMTHDYKRNGTTTLFAALNILEGSVLGRCKPRHRHQEFISFLNAIERQVPAGKIVHVILDDYATHKHPKVCNIPRSAICNVPLITTTSKSIMMTPNRSSGPLRQIASSKAPIA